MSLFSWDTTGLSLWPSGGKAPFEDSVINTQVMRASGSREETFKEHAECYLTITLIIRSTIYKITGLPSLTKTSNMELQDDLNACRGTLKWTQESITLSTPPKLTRNTVQRQQRPTLTWSQNTVQTSLIFICISSHRKKKKTNNGQPENQQFFWLF